MGLPEWVRRDAEGVRSHWWWRPGWGVGTRFYAWHVTLDGQDGLHRVVDGYQRELASIGEIDLIPREWLHLTMQGVGFVDDVDEQALAEIAEAVRIRLGEMEPVVVRLGPVVIRPEAIAMVPMPFEPVQAIRRAIREAMAVVLDDVPEKAEGYQPHVSIGYVNADGDAAPIREALDRADVEDAEVTIGRVSFIEMHRDRRMYEWRTIRLLELGGG